MQEFLRFFPWCTPDKKDTNNKITECKSYVVISSVIYPKALDILPILKGDYDRFYKSDNGSEKPSIVFPSEAIFEKWERAKSYVGNKTKIPGHKYIVGMGYSVEEVKLIAAKGYFSEAIVYAVDAWDVVNKKKEDVKITPNPQYKTDLLTDEKLTALTSSVQQPH